MFPFLSMPPSLCLRLPSSLSSSPSIPPHSHTTTVAPSLNFSCHCWAAGRCQLRNVPLSPTAAQDSAEPLLYVLPPSNFSTLHASTPDLEHAPQPKTKTENPPCLFTAARMRQRLQTTSLFYNLLDYSLCSLTPTGVFSFCFCLKRLDVMTGAVITDMFSPSEGV